MNSPDRNSKPAKVKTILVLDGDGLVRMPVVQFLRDCVFLRLAEKHNTTAPLMIGHRIMGTTLAFTGDIVDALAHYDQTLGLYNAEHRSLATRFGTDSRVTILSFRALVLWLLGYSDTALADADHALKEAREIDQAATLMFALADRPSTISDVFGQSLRARARAEWELGTLADG
jgi:hypothetical protein